MKYLLVLFLGLFLVGKATAGMVFLVDSSGNMYTEDKSLIPALKSKIISDIKNLPEGESFEVVFYVTGYKALFSALVPATEENKGKAIQAIAKVPNDSNGLPADFGKSYSPDKILHGFTAFKYAYDLSPAKIRLYSDGDFISERMGTKPYTDSEVTEELKKIAGTSPAILEVVYFKNPKNDRNYTGLARKVAAVGNGSVDAVSF